MIKIEAEFVEQQLLPRVWRVVQGADAALDIVAAWFAERRTELVRERDRFGAVLVRGFSAIDSAAAFARVLESLASPLMDYVGGSAPRSVVHGRVFNATALPSEFSLPLHQEMAYQEYRPDSLALFCQRAATEGGETTLADARLITSRIDSSLRQSCEPYLNVVRVLPCERQINRTRAWIDVFGTSDRHMVEAIADEKGWRIEWLGNGGLALRQRMPTSKVHPRSKEHVWANQLHYHTGRGMLNWALRDRRADDVEYYSRLARDAPESLDRVFRGDGSELSVQDVDHVWEVLVGAEVPVRWRRGDVLFLDNVLALHGRRMFRGERSILVGMMRDAESHGSA